LKQVYTMMHGQKNIKFTCNVGQPGFSWQSKMSAQQVAC